MNHPEHHAQDPGRNVATCADTIMNGPRPAGAGGDSPAPDQETPQHLPDLACEEGRGHIHTHGNS